MRISVKLIEQVLNEAGPSVREQTNSQKTLPKSIDLRGIFYFPGEKVSHPE
jgi:hypothetical protein